MTPLDRLIDRVTLDENDCWRVSDPRFYATLMINGKQLRAHRFSYEQFRGPIPDGLTIDHLCRVKNCVNPWHLEAVTMHENLLRGDTIPARHARKTHCPQGHEYTEENTKIHSGKRYCRTCQADRWAEFHERERRSIERTFAP